MLVVSLLVWAAAPWSPLQTERNPDAQRMPERVWFARLTREDLDWPRGKGVAKEGFLRLPAKLEEEIDRALDELGADCVHVSGQLTEPRTRVVGIGAREGNAKPGIEKRLGKIGFRVDWLLATAVVGTKHPRDPDRFGYFSQVGGAFHAVQDPTARYAIVLHLPECKPERLLAQMNAFEPTVPWDPIRLEVVTGDPGVGGTRVHQALRDLPGTRLVTPGADATRFTVEVEMRQIPELEPRGKGFGAPSIPIAERLKKEGIEVREAR